MIAACVSTVAASSGHFLLIPEKCSGEQSDGTPVQAYSSLIGNCRSPFPFYSPCSVSFGLLRC
ncbi:DUF2776 family protein [Shigella flexneri]